MTVDLDQLRAEFRARAAAHPLSPEQLALIARMAATTVTASAA